MAVRRRFAERFSRPLKILIQVGVLGVILMAVGTVGFVEYSAQPSFCTNCHLMQPYYDSWASSTHNQVPCIKCHYAPGIKAEAMGKFQAANQVVKYVTGQYGTKPWAEIEDAACLRSGCHTLRRVEGAVDYTGPTDPEIVVHFDHAQHLGQLRLGKQLRCTSCHSQIVQGNHLAVTPSTCYLCHFKGRAAEEPVAGCVACHRSPPRVVSPAGFVVDHPQYVRDLVSCRSCHEQVTSGTGDAEPARCYNCHNEPERLNEFENTALVHRVHITEHNVECIQCHTPIEHRLVSLAQVVDLDCGSCHQRVHEAQQRLYAGLGGHGAESEPSSMFLARVSCQGCHELNRQVRGHENVKAAGEASCMSCHGIRYANILPSWQQEMERKLERVTNVVRHGEQAARSAPAASRLAVDSLMRLARENIEFVRQGKGAHNIAYADRLLRASVDLTRQAVRTGHLAYEVPAVDLGPPVSENICLQCHLGTERRTVPFAGGTFDHEPHVVRQDIACTRCHSGLDDHGKTRLTTTSDCAGCHHQGALAQDCTNCHTAAPAGTFALSMGNFMHAPHVSAGLPCSGCHTLPEVNANSLDCETCHVFHHQPEATCVSCHREGTKAKHDIAFAHLQCSQCHGEAAAGITQWSRKVCTVCHTDKVEHNAPVECTLCHDIAPLTPPSDSTAGGG